jgi:cytochrome oxidase Cu insertion factor (SCO1/SenC/PrrC family)
MQFPGLLMTIKAVAAVFLAAAVLTPLQLSAADSAGAGATRGAPVKAGDIAPDFTLADQDGRSLTLSAERGKRAVVLVFYRGYW